jgi:hypothetical protein
MYYDLSESPSCRKYATSLVYFKLNMLPFPKVLTTLVVTHLFTGHSFDISFINGALHMSGDV